MKKRKIFPSILGFLAFFIVGGEASAALTLRDLEVAIIEQDYQKAEDLAGQFLTEKVSGDEEAQAQYLLGLSYLYRAQYGQAREVFKALAGHCPNARLADKVALGRIDSFLLEGEYKIALKEAQQFLKKNPRSEFLSLVYLKLARIHFKLANWGQAKNYLEKIVRRFPGSPESFTARRLLEERQFFTVQVGSFIDQKRAENLVEELKMKGIYAYIVETMDKDERLFYRVRIGELSTVAEAQGLKTQLTSLGYPTLIYP